MKNLDDLIGERSIATILTALVFFVAILFADVMYLQMVDRVVDPAWRILSIAGAFALGASVLLLPWKLKNGDIKPGNQRTVTMAVLILEFLLMVFNVVLAFAEKAGMPRDGLLDVYATYIMPATPVLVAGGILLIWLADPLDQAAIQESKFDTARKIQRLRLRAGVEVEVIKAIGEYAASDDVKRVIRVEAAEQALALAREVLGVSSTKTLPEPRTIDVTPNDDAVTPTRDTNFVVGIDYAVPGSDQTTITLHASPPPSPSPSRPAPTPYPVIRQAPTTPQKPAYTLQSLLKRLGVATVAEARAMLDRYGIRSSADAYMKLQTFGRIPADLTRAQFDALYAELVAPTPELVSDDNNDDESRWETLYLNNGNGHHPNR